MTSAIWACEVLKHSHAELHLIDPDMCVFDSMLDFLADSTRKDLEDKCANMFLEDLEKLFLERASKLIVRTAECTTHG